MKNKKKKKKTNLLAGLFFLLGPIQAQNKPQPHSATTSGLSQFFLFLTYFLTKIYI
jgi:hypothetical protein